MAYSDWTVQAHRFGYEVYGPEGLIAQVCFHNWDSKDAKEIADLIAAAPKMLEALKAFVEAHEKCLQLEKTDVALRMAKSAIAAAEGREVGR